MFDRQDIALLKGMFAEQETNLEKRLEKRVRILIQENNKVLRSDIIREVRDEMHSCISASEKRMMNRMDQLIYDVKISVAEIMSEHIFPQIAELQNEIILIKRHVGMV